MSGAKKKITLSVAETSSVASSVTQDFQEESSSHSETDSAGLESESTVEKDLEACSYPVIENPPGPIYKINNNIDENEFARFIRLPPTPRRRLKNVISPKEFLRILLAQ